MIDLRSDTVTKPTPEMLEFMMNAPVGDDVYSEDPSINELEQKAANIFGMEAAMYCPSGTMTNQVAIKCHTKPGDEVLCDMTAHVYNYEGGGIAFNSGASVKLMQGDRGKFTAQQVLDNINPDNVHAPRTSLVVIENTSNRGGGSYFTLDEVKNIANVCRDNHLPLHLDGARIFNALTVTGEDPKEHARYFDSISICLSKGLGAPVGSMLLGRKDFIKQARRYRKVLGGAMRQAGFLAAAGIYALDHHIIRLKDDHRRAKELGKALQELPYIEQMLPVETNIVIFKLKDDFLLDDFTKKMQAQNILISPMGKQWVRLVTHLQFDDGMLERVAGVLRKQA